MNELIMKLKSKLDIDLMGIVEAKPLEQIRKSLEDHKMRKFSTTFESDDLESRINPMIHLKNAKSIFVIGQSYCWNEEEKGRYLISNYSRGMDYHIVLREKLEKLKVELSKSYDFDSYIQVDSGDLFEKEFGRLAGFGFIGKNSLLINEEFGSYIFLGILVTDIEFEEFSKEYIGDCGDCNICQRACPSGSILGDYNIDASICHSYLTQWKEEVPDSNNIKYAYGCDICQIVCPKNKNIIKNKHEEFKPKIFNFDNLNIKNMSNREYKEKFKEYSFSWVGKKLILRNIGLIERRG